MTEVERLEVAPVLRIRGEVAVPGDKSISHRLAMIGSLAEGETVIQGFASSVDCRNTLDCLRELGVPINQEASTVTIQGRGLEGLQKPLRPLNAGNSGTTVRLMCGLVAGCPFEVTFIGDESLSHRPMNRIIEPLRRYGVTIEARDDNYLPLKIEGGSLFGVTYNVPVASAQVKSALLLAALHVRGGCTILEKTQTRNHTEIALAEFGVYIQCSPTNGIDIVGGRPLQGKSFSVPGDISSAAFLIAAALSLPESQLKITGVGLNPTRTGFIDLLQQMGGRITVSETAVNGGEPVGDVIVESSELSGMDIGAKWIPNVIDELPILAVLGTRTRQGIRIRDASELRAKETDRIRAIAANLKALGAQVEEFPDGLLVPGGQTLRAGAVDSFGDHRIAMAFGVAGLFSEGPVTIQNPSCVDISFPGFFETLKKLATDYTDKSV